MTKYEIRKKIKDLRIMLNEEEKIQAADRVFSKIEELAAFQLADKILIYHSLPDELDTRRFIQKWKNLKQFFLPRVNGVNLDILSYDESRLEIGSFHIEEPVGDETVSVDEIELLLIPGVAFDRSGRRLGRGKGFYDRLLQNGTATTIGVAYSFQVVDSLPSEAHDIPMDIVVTEDSIIYRKKHK